MAQRTLNSAFWDDGDVAQLSFPERLLFACMCTDESLSDDWGCLPAHPRTLKKHAFGYDDNVTVDQVREWRDHILSTCRNAVLYTVNGQEYIYLRNFAKWQRLQYHRKSNTPRPPRELVGQTDEEPGETLDDSEKLGEIPETVSESTEKVATSRVGLGSVGQGRVGQGRDEKTLGADETAPAADCSDDEQKPERKRSARDEARLALELHFSQTTGIPRPVADTEKQRRAAASTWWDPLREVGDMCEWDVGRARGLISQAYEHLKGRVTISSPKSLLKTAIAIKAGNAPNDQAPRAMPARNGGAPSVRWDKPCQSK